MGEGRDKERKRCCCVPGCNEISERSYAFSTVCEAADVSVSEEANVCSPLSLCSHHYFTAYSYCQMAGECALCGSKSKQGISQAHKQGRERGISQTGWYSVLS
jgi:hypothetical protein